MIFSTEENAVYKLLNKNTRERLKVEEDILNSPHELE